MLFTLLLLVTLFWIFIAIDTYRGIRELPKLEPEPPTASCGLVSIIVPARNEAHTIEKSIRSQLQQTYKPIEWILVNDRSTDGTGEIMENLAKSDSRIHVQHVSSLPKGWLGKNYALHKGAELSAGNLLVFTDADILYEPDLIAKAAAYFTRNSLDHLTISPNLQARSFMLKGFISFFLFGFSYYKRPWNANRDHKKGGMGIGAFNMISRTSYQKMDGHQSIRMRPDDDLQLGILVKKHGFKQRMVTAITMLKVEWYPTVAEAVKGLEKNTFAGLHYSYLLVAGAAAGVFISQFLPFITLFHSEAAIRLISAAAICALAVVYLPLTRRLTSYSSWHVILFPLSVCLFIFAICRASFLTLKRGGIQWRGTTYSLKEMKKQMK
ncbi:glycosyltransferase [Jeotgalibacillus proteolyticus]|uniref:4,4'-diaponeurosporenoate glycosyltransferase n=1 Tax=Jeotgalibacillus proteolyticus TaxID=2082395 RepID=A0A2S5GEN3_9BACL|nr:glycosyltransferase family 2 protein [Jeotgalibacillus proteolyticus]PPA71333.1 glycosyl transferase [Jeotgalibacillus proteolyticus]